MVIISSIWSLAVMTEGALAVPDKFGTDQLYSIADEHEWEVKLELWVNRVATSLPFHYLGSLTSICRFISIFSCFRLKPWVNWFWLVAFLSHICLQSHRTRYKVDPLLPAAFYRIFAVRFAIDNKREK